MDQDLRDIDALVHEEKRLTAMEQQSEAWADGLLAGIEPEILAEAALSTALSELLRDCGEDAALQMLDRVREKVIAGDLDLDRHYH